MKKIILICEDCKKEYDHLYKNRNTKNRKFCGVCIIKRTAKSNKKYLYISKKELKKLLTITPKDHFNMVWDFSGQGEIL